MRTIDPRNLPHSFTITEARNAELGQHPRLLDGLLYIGLMVLFSPPGLGKSMLAAAIEEHLAFGQPFGPWIPERPHRSLVIDLEGDMRLAAERSLTLTRHGLLASDHGRPMAADIEYETVWRGTSFEERLAALAERLEEGQRAEQPYSYVRIDTMRLFLGAKPHGVNAYEWDAHCLTRLNKLALWFNVALVTIHHTNKAGEVSGSTGVAGSAIVVAHLKRNPDNDDECLLVSEKVRVDEPFRYALMMDDRGRWEFTEEITPAQAELTGTKRALVDILTARGPQIVKDLRERLPNIPRNTIKAALRRLSNEGIVVYRRAQWELTQATLEGHPKCSVCGAAMEAYGPGQHSHPTCTEDPSVDAAVKTFLGLPGIPAQSSPSPLEEARSHPVHIEDQEDQEDQEEEAEDTEHPEVTKWPAFAEMKASIAASRMKPVPRIPKEEREGKPWSLITEAMDGAHRTRSWSGALPESAQLVIVLDRNGSYPSAMSSVPVAPNTLKHTGALGADPLARQNVAGLFQIVPPVWTDERIPSPLGRLAEGPEGEPVWITGSHMEFLDKLARDGVLPVVDVLDSWTGRRNCSLFERYYKWAAMVRKETAGAEPEVRDAAKQSISKAIRSLHPKQARSPFWRPDWHKAVVAQASVRHWATAYRAVEGGASLLSIGSVDEVAFAVPTDVEAPKLWVPTPYRIGYGFGQVKHKEIVMGEEKALSPVTVEQWKARGVRHGKR